MKVAFYLFVFLHFLLQDCCVINVSKINQSMREVKVGFAFKLQLFSFPLQERKVVVVVVVVEEEGELVVVVQMRPFGGPMAT
jgi:hypothetical protein